MKKSVRLPVYTLLFLLLGGCPTFLTAQMRTLRYWYNGDRSTLQQVSFGFTAGDEVELAFDTDRLNFGVHYVTIQTVRADGRFSPSTSALFIKQANRGSTDKGHLRIWVDSLHSTPLLQELSPTASVFDLSILLKGDKISHGLHTLYMQYVDPTGSSSPLASACFVSHRPSKGGKAKFEAWVDDPKRTPIFTKEIENSLLVTPLQEINTSSLKAGIHTLYMQYTDVDGSVSPLVSSFFIKSPIGTAQDPIVGLRYWFDNDQETSKEHLFSTPVSSGEICEVDLSARHVFNGNHLITMAPLSKSGIIGQPVSDSIEVTNGLPSSVQVSTLTPDPNSLIDKKLTQGSILTFYYRIEDKEQKPVEGVTLKAYFGSKEFTSTVSDKLGIVALEIDTESKGIKPNDGKLTKGDSVLYRLASVSVGKKLLNIHEKAWEESEYTLAYDRIPNSFEIALKSGANLSTNKLDWFSLGIGSNGKLKLKYNPDGTFKEFEAGSGGKASPKIKASNFIEEFSFYGEIVESATGDPTPANSLAAIDRLSRGFFPLMSAQGYAYAHALNLYLKSRGKDLVAFSDEQHGLQFGGQASMKLDYNGVFEPFKIKDWGCMIDFRGLHFGGTLGMDVQPPSLNYIGSQLKELKDSRQPHGEFKLSLKDVTLTNDGIMIKGLRCLYDGNPNIWTKQLFTQSTDTQLNFSFKHDFTQSPHLNYPLELKTSYSFGISYPFNIPLASIFNENGEDALIKTLSFSPKLTWKNSISSKGLMLGLMYQLGDDKQRRSTIPSIVDFSMWDLWGFMSCFLNKEQSMRTLWESVQKNSKNNYIPTMEELKEGYKASSSVEVSVAAGISLPLVPWCSLKQEGELSLLYDVGASYYHPQAGRLVRPIRYERMDILLQPDQVAKGYYQGVKDVLGYFASSWTLLQEDISAFVNTGWDKATKSIKNGWVFISSAVRSIDEQMRHYDFLRATSFEDKSQIDIAYKDDYTVFDQSTEVDLISRFTAGQVFGITAQGDSILLIGDLFRVYAEQNGKALSESKTPYKIRGRMGADDLRFFALPPNTPLTLYHISDNNDIWEPVGDVGKEHFVSKLGYYAMGCKFESDTTPPTITVAPDFINGYIDVKILDNFALHTDKMGASIDGDEVQTFSLIGEVARITLSKEQLQRDSLSLYVFATDVAGNVASSIFELKNPLGSQVHPVLSNEEVHVRYSKSEEALHVDIAPNLVGKIAYIYDISGALYKLITLTETSNKYSMKDLLDGTYILQIDSISQRFIKQ